MNATAHLVAAITAAFSVHTAACAQGNWVQLNPTGPVPAPRWQHQTSFDIARGKLVVFGGRLAAVSYQDDTWEFDGTSWTQMAPTTVPPGRYLGAMCYDLIRGNTVMFGGLTNGPLSETWLWDGVDWTLAQPSTVPPNRRQQGMAYDSIRGVVVMFGGGYQNDTWEWDGVDWTQIQTPNAPSGRNCRMAFDANRGVMVLHGGDTSTNVYNGETWEYDGSDWTQRFPANSPGVRVSATIEYDLVAQRIVLFGGFIQSFQNVGDTWEWDGYDWIERAPATSPSPRRDFDNSAYDLLNSRLITFGGYGPGVQNDLWTYQAAQTGDFTIYGPDCPPAGGAVTFSGTTPTIGQSFDLDYGNLGTATGVLTAYGESDTVWNGVPLPADLAAIGLPGCELRTSAEVTVFSLASGGVASHSFVLPNSPAIYGLQFFCQGLVVDFASSQLFPGATGLGRARIGS
ncbi:MAG: hypothetical protein ACE37K_04955 [Planctomycetota bacterium]